jgi:hypothetical protein
MIEEGEREFSCNLYDAKFFTGSDLSRHFRLNHRTDLQWVFDQKETM